MTDIRDELRDEIRINHKYAHLYLSEYTTKTIKGKSTPKISERTLLTTDYLKRITSGAGGISPIILPPNCRYLDVTNAGSVVVIEEPPAFRTISINMSFNSEISRLESNGKLEEYGYNKNSYQEKINRLTLAFPYVIFILYVNDFNELVCGQSFLRVARLTGLADYLLRIPLLNIGDGQYICFGSEGHGKQVTLNASVERAIDTFWGAEFNPDHTSNYRAYKNVAGVHSYLEWQALSQSNPMFIYNVDWIRHSLNLGQALNKMKTDYKLLNKGNIGYKNLSDIFHNPADTGRDEKPSKRSRQKYRLFYDVAEGTFLDDNFCIHVGDSFYIKKGKTLCHVNSLISFLDSGDIKYIRVERDDGRLIIYKNTKAFTKYLLTEAKKVRFEEKGVLKNGVVIKENDILIMKNSLGRDLYRKVSYIRKSQEGFYEGRFGDGFFILENTEAEIFDIKTPKYHGIVMEKDEQYIYITNYQSVPMHPGSVVTYDQVDVNSMGQLAINLRHVDKNIRNRPYQLKLEGGDSQTGMLFHKDGIKSLPPFFRIGRKLLVLRKSGSKLLNRVFGSPSGIIYDSNASIDRPNIVEISKYMLSGDKFHVQSFDMDIEFTIGEKVVVSDWEKPFNMLTVKMIQGFKFDDSTGDITFILADKEGKLHQERYVDGANGVIFVGRIRKIVNKFGKLAAGTKIKAKEANIPHFPMKDINIIIGFITDTGGPEPLVLCSNCCTLWYNDVIDKFHKTTMKAKKWAQMQHAPIDIAKIKFQAGDIIQGKSGSDYRSQMGWLVFNPSGRNSLRILDFRYYSSHADSYLLDRYIAANSRLDGIPNPRIGPKAQSDMGHIAAWNNLHGYSFTCARSAFRFINDERSVVNVQSSPK